MNTSLDKGLVDWLVGGGPWLRYAVETQLLGLHPDAAAAAGDPPVRVICSCGHDGEAHGEHRVISALSPCTKCACIRFSEKK